MRSSRPLAALVTAAALALLIAAPARADLAWGPCTDAGFQAFECATAPQPLDRAGAVPGTVNLFTRRLRAPENSANTAVVALAGGPGQAAAPIAVDFATALAPALQDRDLIVFDQRGTGRSDPLQCPSLVSTRSTSRAVAQCARDLGPRRGFFRTADSVDDLEALRAQTGYAKLVLYGVSYGTKVALDYAARYPDKVDRLVLDSVVAPEGPDPLQRSSFRAVPRVLRELCGAGRCTSATPNPVRDVRTLVKRGRLIRGTYVDARGRKRKAGLEAETIYSILRAGDLNPAWRALGPGAVRAAVRGDTAPLVRLAAATLGAPAGSQSLDDPTNSQAVFLATLCEEGAFPWDRNASTSAREKQATAALLRVPASTFTPFTRVTSASSGLLSLCLPWPNASPAPAPPGALPSVPTLIVNGGADLRTPIEDAATVASRITGATVITVPGVGHSVLGSDSSGCAQAAIAGFFNGLGVTQCPSNAPAIPPLERPVRSLNELPVTAGIKGRVGRTLTAVVRTRNDALVRAAGARLDGVETRFGGLRGGTITQSTAAVTLRRDTYVPGVTVSGTFPSEGDARVSVGGSRGATGTLTFTRDGRLTGRLGGRRIALRAQARAASAKPKTKAPYPALVRAAGDARSRFVALDR